MPSKNFSLAFGISCLSSLFSNRFVTFEKGIDEIARKLAEKLDVRYSSSVTSIQRNNQGARLTYRTDQEQRSCQARKVIMAAAGDQVLELLNDAPDELRHFFHHIEYGSMTGAYFTAEQDIY